MSDIQAQFSRAEADRRSRRCDAIQRLIEKGEDHELNRINVLDFSQRPGSTKRR
jgi:hypothetical protein